MNIWNPGQRQLIGTAFIPENKEPEPFGEIPLPTTFCFQGDAFRKISANSAIRLDSGQTIPFGAELLVIPQTNTKAIWQNAFGVKSWG